MIENSFGDREVILTWDDGTEWESTLYEVIAFRALYGKPSYSWRFK